MLCIRAVYLNYAALDLGVKVNRKTDGGVEMRLLSSAVLHRTTRTVIRIWIPLLGFVESRLCVESKLHQQFRDFLSPTHSYKLSLGAL